MSYRVWCEYKPAFKRADGGANTGPKQGRGAWIINAAYPIAPGDANVPVARGFFAVGLISPVPRRVGTRVNPYKLLCAELEARRLARAINRIGNPIAGASTHA